MSPPTWSASGWLELFGRALLDTDPYSRNGREGEGRGATAAVHVSQDLKTCHKPVV
jgi:hypothetical protein